MGSGGGGGGAASRLPSSTGIGGGTSQFDNAERKKRSKEDPDQQLTPAQKEALVDQVKEAYAKLTPAEAAQQADAVRTLLTGAGVSPETVDELLKVPAG
jgi:hypothetical protein